MSKAIAQKDREISLSDVGRSILNSVVLISTSLLLLAVSCLAFLFFYHHNVPAIGVERSVHLQYGKHQSQVNPMALVDLEFSTAHLTTAQPYNIIVELVVPDSPSNHDLGNFMVGLSMLGSDSETIVEVARSAILRYSSPIIDTASTVLKGAPILLGLQHESQTLKIPLLENYQFEAGWVVSPAQAKIELFAPSLRVYSCRLLFETRMSGLPWLLYNFKLTSFVIFTMLFWFSSMLFMLLTWALVSFTIVPHQVQVAKDEQALRLSNQQRQKKSAEDSHVKKEEEEPYRSTFPRSREHDAVSVRSVAPSSIETSFFDFEPRDRRAGSVLSDATTIEGDQFVKIEEDGSD